MDVSIDRTSPTVMVVSWTPLNYVEARGFISHYTVAYSPQTKVVGERDKHLTPCSRLFQAWTPALAQPGTSIKINDPVSKDESVVI